MTTPPSGSPDARAAALWLVPLPPQQGAPVPVTGSTFWIGASPDAGLPLYVPGAAPRHAVLVARADGYWLTPQRAARDALRVNREPLVGPVRLAEGDVIELVPGVAYRVASSARPATPTAPAPVAPPPVVAAVPERVPWWRRVRWRRRRRTRRSAGRRVRWLGVALAVVALALLGGAGIVLVRVWRRPAESVPSPLTDAEAAAYDALTDRASDHVERGAALLELGLPDDAVREFGAAVAALESSPLRDNAWVKPRIAALEAGIGAVYRERRVATPSRYAGAVGAARAPLARAARLTPEAFGARLVEVQDAFAARFGRPLVITGRDHAEHVALYGPGGAVDLRVRDLTRDQVAFAVRQLLSAGMRVKDFSTDAVLQAQIAAARQAGLADRAGTALHLHVDRFAERSDRWTVR